jgi:hypothetical protein
VGDRIVSTVAFPAEAAASANPTAAMSPVRIISDTVRTDLIARPISDVSVFAKIAWSLWKNMSALEPESTTCAICATSSLGFGW